jgi:hypothetical protein
MSETAKAHAHENANLARDMQTAERIHGRGTPTATRLAAHDLAIREGIAW